MDFLVNDFSLHTQFDSLEAFESSITRLMKVRAVARRHGRDVYCHRAFLDGSVMEGWPLAKAIANLVDKNRVRAVMAWVSKTGPFWEDEQQHCGDDWYEYDGDIVTDCALGEAAHCLLHGVERGLVSLAPSDFEQNLLFVDHVEDDAERRTVEVSNFVDPDELGTMLAEAPTALVSWSALEELARIRFDTLVFTDDAFVALERQPFKAGSAQRVLVLLQVLQNLRSAVDESGRRTSEGQEIYQRHFTGDKAWFSDSSDTEKRDFENDLTFNSPFTDEQIFCPWHGKVKTLQMRIHFTWPVSADERFVVAYVGPKITKR